MSRRSFDNNIVINFFIHLRFL